MLMLHTHTCTPHTHLADSSSMKFGNELSTIVCRNETITHLKTLGNVSKAKPIKSLKMEQAKRKTEATNVA